MPSQTSIATTTARSVVVVAALALGECRRLVVVAGVGGLGAVTDATQSLRDARLGQTATHGSREWRGTQENPVLTAPVSAVQVLFATVRARLGRVRSVKTESSGAGGGVDGPGRARTVTNRARTALTGAVRTVLKAKMQDKPLTLFS